MHRALVVLLLLSGCAFGLSGPDPGRPRSKVPECDTGKGLVVLDGVMAATAGIIALTLAGENEGEAALIPVAIGSLYVGGAIRGNGRVNECRKAMGDFESYMAARETMPARSASPPDAPGEEPAQEPGAPIAASVRPPAMIEAPGAPEPGPPAPRPTPAVTTAAKRTAKPAPAPEKADDEWTDFWREVE